MESNWKTTFTLLVLVVGLGLWVWWGEGQLQPQSEWESREKRLFPHLKQDQVTGVEIIRGEPGQPPQRVVLERLPGEGDKDATWRMLAPVEDEADHAAANRLVNNLEWAQFASRLSGPAAQGFDFGKKLLEVVIYRRETVPYRLEVGEKRASGEHPVRVEGRDGVFLVRPDLIGTNFPSDPFEWRKKELLSLGGRAIDHIALERPGAPKLELTFTDGFWRLGASGEFADRKRVEELVAALRALKAKGVEANDPSPADLERTLGATPLALELGALPQGEGKERGREVLLLGSADLGEGVRHARVSGRPTLYRADAGALLAALAGDEAAWRSDVLLPVAGSADTVTGCGARWPDGTEWHLEKKDDGWYFAGEPAQRAADSRAADLAKELAGLKVLERPDPAGVDSAATGLGQPHLQVALREGTLQRELEVGNPVEGRPGVYWVTRPNDGRVYLADLGVLPERLRAARLELLDSVLLRASHFDQKRIRLLEPDGSVTLEAEKVKETVDGAEQERWKVLTQPSQAPADPAVFARWCEAFDQVPVSSWVALDSEAARREAGLDAPRKLVITLAVYKESKLVEEERTLLLGRREGGRVLAQSAGGGGAIGLIDAGFLDRLARGFSPGKELLAFDKYQVRRFEVRQGDQVQLELQKPGEVWKRGLEVLDTTGVEKLLEAFERLEVTRAEAPTPERLAATGLDAPTRRVTIVTKPFDGGPEQTRTLLLGAPAGEGEVWAMAEGGDTVGALLVAPLRALDAWEAAHPPQAPFPPVGPDGPR